eukprot:6180267-Pleurochrysis_carterae.AAC.3
MDDAHPQQSEKRRPGRSRAGLRDVRRSPDATADWMAAMEHAARVRAHVTALNRQRATQPLKPSAAALVLTARVQRLRDQAQHDGRTYLYKTTKKPIQATRTRTRTRTHTHTHARSHPHALMHARDHARTHPRLWVLPV